MRWTRMVLPDQGARSGRRNGVVPTPQWLVSSSQLMAAGDGGKSAGLAEEITYKP